MHPHWALAREAPGPRVKSGFSLDRLRIGSKGLSIDRQVRAAWPYLSPTPGATDGPLDRLPASLRVSAQASASSSGASRLWSRRARCLTTWTSRSRAAPERADHLWCAPLSCPIPLNEGSSTATCVCVDRASRIGRDARTAGINADVPASQTGPAIWELSFIDEFEAQGSQYLRW